MISVELLTHVVEREYPAAKSWRNVWIGCPVSDEDNSQVSDSAVMQWEVAGVPEPTQDELQALCSQPKCQLWEARRVKTIELHAANDAELAQGVTSNGHTFSLQQLKEQFDITAMASAVQTGLPTTTRPKLPTLEGPRVELTDQEVVDLAAAAHDKVATTANHLGDKLEAVALATTAAEVEAITR